MSNDLHRAVRNASIKSILSNESRKRKRVIQTFAGKIGLVNFGSVDQFTDSHDIVRGFTVSASHRDDNYCVGSVGEYDITLVDRSDAVWQKDGSINIYKWLIVSFKLKSAITLPHFFVTAKGHLDSHYETMFTIHSALKPVEMGTFEDYGEDFKQRFELFAKPADSIEMQRLIPADTARVFSAHFWPLSVECADNVLYLYSNGQEIGCGLLDTMIENGLWLAGHLDLQIENI